MARKFFAAMFMALSVIIFSAAPVSAENIFVTEYRGVRYFVLDDRIYKGDIDPNNLFELDIGTMDASGYDRTMYSQTVRFQKDSDGKWYIRFKSYGGTGGLIYGTVYEIIFNFCRARYY